MPLALLLLAKLGPTLPARPIAHPRITAEELRLDGRLDEPAWKQAQDHVVGHQKLPLYDGPVTQPTRFKILFADDALWIGVRCDQDVALVPRRTRRDRAVEADRSVGHTPASYTFMVKVTRLLPG